MIDMRIVEVVRRLLHEAHEGDRAALIDWCAGWAEIILRKDHRCRHACFADPVLGSLRERTRGTGSYVGSLLVQPIRSSDGWNQVRKLHECLLYTAAKLDAPRIHKEIATSEDGSLFARSRRFFDSLDDEQLYALLRTCVSREVKQEAYREFSRKVWRYLKGSLIYLATRTELPLTLIQHEQRMGHGRKKWTAVIAHSKFFDGRRKIDAKDFGAIPGRIVTMDELYSYSFVRSGAILQQTFGEQLAEQLDTETPVLIELDALTTARLSFLESISQSEAPWAGPARQAGLFYQMGLPPYILALLIGDLILIEVGKAFARHRKNRPQEIQRVLVWEAATRARLEAHFGLGYLGFPAQDWNAVLQDGLARLGLASGLTSDQNVVSFKYRGIKDRITRRIVRDFGPDA